MRVKKFNRIILTVFFATLLIILTHGGTINWTMDATSTASSPDGSSGNAFPNITSLLSFVSTQPATNNYVVTVMAGTYDLSLVNYHLARNVTFNANSNVLLRQLTIPTSSTPKATFSVTGCTLVFNNWNIHQFRGPSIGYTFYFFASQAGTITFVNCSWNGDDIGYHGVGDPYYLNYNNTFVALAVDGSAINLYNCKLQKMRFLFGTTQGTTSSLSVTNVNIQLSVPVYLNDSSSLYYSIFGAQTSVVNITNVVFQTNCANLLYGSNDPLVYIEKVTISYTYFPLFDNKIYSFVFDTSLAGIDLFQVNSLYVGDLTQTGTAPGDEPSNGTNIFSLQYCTGSMSRISLTSGTFQTLYYMNSVSLNVTELSVQNCNLEYVFNIPYQSYVLMENSLISGVTSVDDGSAIIFSQYSTYFTTKNSTVIGNSLGFSCTYSSAVTIVNDSLIINNQNIFMEIWTSSEFYMYRTVFQDSECVSTKPCMTNAYITLIDSSQILGINASAFLSAMLNVPTIFNISNTTMSYCSFGGLLFDTTVTGMSNISIVNSLFEYQSSPLFNVNGLSWISIFNTTFQFLQQQAVIIGGNVSYAIIDTCRFTNNVIINTQELITGPAGTAVWSYGTAPYSLLVNNSYFTRNVAITSYGGCIALQNLVSNFSAVIMNTMFINNSALVGGAIYSDSLTNFVNIVNSTFIGNKGVQYGPNTATARKISRMVNIPGQNSTSGRPNTINIYSGDSLSSVSIMEYDAYGQVIYSGLLNARFGMLDITTNQGYNHLIVGDTKRIFMTNMTTFVSVTIIGDAPPPILLNDIEAFNSSSNNNSSNSTIIPSYYQYNLTLYEIDIRGIIVQTLDYIPLNIPRCSQKLQRLQVNSEYGIPTCIPITCAQGCVAGQGVCNEINNCTCFVGYEGEACQLTKGNEDSIQFTFNIKGNISNTDFIANIINVLTAKYDLGSNKFVYRNYEYDQTSQSIMYFNISIENPRQVFVEGAQLKYYVSLMQPSTFSNQFIALTNVQYMESPKGYLHPNQSGVTFLYVFDSMAIIVSICIAALLWIYRTNRMIKNIFPLISIFMVFGLLLVQIGVLFYIGLPTEASCILRKVLIDIGFTIFFGCAAMKSYRLYSIFKTMSKYSDKKLLLQILGITVVPLVIIIITFIISSHPLVPVVQESNNTRFWVCQASSTVVDDIFDLLMFILECALLAFNLLLSIANRQCWATFSETITLSLSIYITVFLALISYVVAQIGSTQETILYTYTYMYTAGSTLLLLALYVPRLLSARSSETVASDDSGKIAAMVSKMEVNIPLFEDQVEVKISDGWASFLGTGWRMRPAVISEGELLYFPDYKNRAHILSKMMVLDRSKVIPLSFQIVGKKTVYWVKCKDENQFYLWLAILLKQCKQTDENFAENL